LIYKESEEQRGFVPISFWEDLTSSQSGSVSEQMVIHVFDGRFTVETTRPDGYSGPVADDYPDCLAIQKETRVKPERAKLGVEERP